MQCVFSCCARRCRDSPLQQPPQFPPQFPACQGEQVEQPPDSEEELEQIAARRKVSKSRSLGHHRAVEKVAELTTPSRSEKHQWQVARVESLGGHIPPGRSIPSRPAVEKQEALFRKFREIEEKLSLSPRRSNKGKMSPSKARIVQEKIRHMRAAVQCINALGLEARAGCRDPKIPSSRAEAIRLFRG